MRSKKVVNIHVLSESKTQTFPLLSPHVGEKVRRQNFLRTGDSSDSSQIGRAHV
jgi:hypothetical protein